MDTQNVIAATEPTPTLAELLAARAEERAEAERENARREQISREQDRSEALDYVTSWMLAHISPALADALRIIPAVDDACLDEESDDYRGIALAGYLQLDVSGALVDTGAADGAETQSDTSWTIRRTHRRYVGYLWTLNGPHEYVASLGEVYNTEENLDRVILDAITGWPAWVASADERRASKAEEERREREKAERRNQATPRHYTSVVGGRDGGMLDRGNRIEVRAFNPWAENGFVTFAASVVEYSDTWLLLNVGARQRLIPVAQVIDIHPLPNLAPEQPDDQGAQE